MRTWPPQLSPAILAVENAGHGVGALRTYWICVMEPWARGFVLAGDFAIWWRGNGRPSGIERSTRGKDCRSEPTAHERMSDTNNPMEPSNCIPFRKQPSHAESFSVLPWGSERTRGGQGCASSRQVLSQLPLFRHSVCPFPHPIIYRPSRSADT